MPTTTKKGSKSTKAKPRRVVVKASPNKQAQAVTELRQELAESLQRENATASENVRLVKELQERSRDLTEALEHQTATAEVLGSSPLAYRRSTGPRRHGRERGAGLRDR